MKKDVTKEFDVCDFGLCLGKENLEFFPKANIIVLKDEDDGYFDITVNGHIFAGTLDECEVAANLEYLFSYINGCTDIKNGEDLLNLFGTTPYVESTPHLKKKTLETMISAHAYDEIVKKVKEKVGEESFSYIFPAVKKALEEGSGAVREEILINWLDCNSMRVCSYCGKIMQEGWYLGCKGYACSDECAAESEGITMEEFKKYRIYKDDILQHLEDEGEGRKIEDLTEEECDEIIDKISNNINYYYTEWY